MNFNSLPKLSIFLPFLSAMSAQYLTLADFNAKLTSIYDNLTASEHSLVQSFAAVVSTADFVSGDLKASHNHPRVTNMAHIIDDCLTLATSLGSMQSHRKHRNISSCEDANRKLIDIHFEIRKLGGLVGDTQLNRSQLMHFFEVIEQSNEQLMIDIRSAAIQMKHTERIVTDIIEPVRAIIANYSEYMALLHVSIERLTNITAPLQEFIDGACVSLPSLTDADGLLLARAVANVDSMVVGLPNAIYEKVVDANRKANVVFAKIPMESEPDIITAVDNLVGFFNRLLTIADSYTATFGNVSSCRDIHARIGFLRYKQLKFGDLVRVCDRNLTQFSALFSDFSESTKSSTLEHDPEVAVTVFTDWAKYVQAAIQYYMRKLQEQLLLLAAALNYFERWPQTVCRVVDKPAVVRRAFNVSFQPDTVGGRFRCAFWSKFVANDSLPRSTFVAGTSVNGTPLIVGRAKFFNHFFPARVHVSAGHAAMLMSTTVGEVRATYGEVLVLPDGCACSWQKVRDAANFVALSNEFHRIAIGRKLLCRRQVTLTVVDLKTRRHKYTDSYGVQFEEPAREVLACEAQSFVGELTVATEGKACALWTPYDGDDAPRANGFAVAADNFIGRGFYLSDLLPGRVRLNGTRGSVYAVYGLEFPTQFPEYLALPAGCSCAWVTTETAVTRTGLVDIPNANVHFLVGRKMLANGQWTVAKVIRSNFLQIYANETGENSVGVARELLVCESA